jgi:thiol-disulfide isomerase/thioredoxin
MKDGRTVVIAGLFIIIVVFGFSYYSKKSPSPPPSNQQASNSATPTESTASAGSAALIEQARKNGESMWLFFRSTTCVPCVDMQKIFDQIQPEYQGKVRFIAIDVNDRKNIEIIKTWKIQYIPTSFIIDSAGKVSYQNVGVIPVENLKKELNKVVK